MSNNSSSTSTVRSLLEAFGFGPEHIISVYTRADALADGVLVDVTSQARQAGWAVPVALTTAAYHECVSWPAALNELPGLYQHQSGRLWDVLMMGCFAARANGGDQEICFGFNCVPYPHNRADYATTAKLTFLKIVVGPGDRMEPVITIMLPEED